MTAFGIALACLVSAPLLLLPHQSSFFVAGQAPLPTPVNAVQLKTFLAKLFVVEHSVKMTLKAKTDTTCQANKLAEKLLVPESADTLKMDTFKATLALFEKYGKTLPNPDHMKEEKHFVTTILRSDVMRKVVHYLRSKKRYLDDFCKFEKFFTDLWMKKDAQKKNGFQRVFMPADTDVTPANGWNWLQYHQRQEASPSTLENWGSKQIESINNNVKVLNTFLKVGAVAKECGGVTVVVGTLPELELAVYTLCNILQQGNKVNVAGTKYFVQTAGSSATEITSVKITQS